MAKSNDNVAYAYAQALYEAAKEANALPQIEAELAALVDVLAKQLGKGTAFFDSPSVGFAEKAAVYKKTFGGKVHPLLLNFILTVVKHGRSPAMLTQCLVNFRGFYNTLEGIAQLEVRSARKLDDAEMTKLKAVMSKKLSQKIQVTETVSPELLGGFVVLHQNQQWDATISSRLDRLKTQLKEAKFPSSVLKD